MPPFIKLRRLLTCIVKFQEKRLAQEINDIEKDTGFKLRVLAQNYPDTPGVIFIFIFNDIDLVAFF